MTSPKNDGPPIRPRIVPITDEPLWYKDAVIYELRTRSFFDSNDDGVGDFRGLAARLGYLQDLGVTALWLLPFYPSPGKDDGYDIANYTGIHPDLGTLEDFEHLMAEAHRRGLRVITELVLNHTSDEHPWFRRARAAAPGSVEREFYVWTQTPDRYKEARIIFKDFERSNWSWDHEAGAYFWHRFYSHQPDLNFENPAVHDALLEVVDFWLSKGVDGLRLDAVPYLYEEDGTTGENLPQTHAFLKKLRAHIDSKFKHRILLAEANQWPEDAAAYFGEGDECHMNFHFPLMPRMFMSLHMEDRFPIVDIFAQTPDLHPSCQWALFLRNHDELTLEMVTDEERDYMYRAYATQSAMRINLGIRRRLAPLLGNSRRKIELLNGLLFSLPGTPVLYYGDEIGMGDNVYLGDRNGVRTPMQWSMDRNAGFSRANPQRLILPVILDPEYHYESLNVENQQQNPTSLLWWTKRLVALRKRFVAFGRGSIEFLSPANSHVLAFVRQHGEERVLVVANLSRFVQYVELDLSKHKGMFPIELFGKTRFPAVGDAPYVLTLGPHGFYWFSLEQAAAPGDPRVTVPPSVVRCTSVDALLRGDERPLLEEALPAFLARRPWYVGQGRMLRAVRIVEALPLQGTPITFTVVRAEYGDAASELYAVPLTLAPASSGETHRQPVLAFLRLAGEPDDAPMAALVDAALDPSFCRSLLRGATQGSSALVPSALAHDVPAEVPLEPHEIMGEGHRTTIRCGDGLVLSLTRRLDEGTSPDFEIGHFLAQQRFGGAAQLCGAIELTSLETAPATVAVLHRFVPNVGTGWQLALQELGRYYERVLSLPPGRVCPPPERRSPMLLAGTDPPPLVSEMIGGYRDVAAQLGARIAELHGALGSNRADPAFRPEPYSALDRRSKYQALRNLAGRAARTLRAALPTLSPAAVEQARSILAREEDIVDSFEPLLHAKMSALRIRVHGNLHLGHVLYTGRDFVVANFDGFAALSLAERRRKRSPLRDLAWMARSLELAAFKVLLDPGRIREGDVPAALPWAVQWASWTSTAFLSAYLGSSAALPFVPPERDQAAVLFDAFVMERALYQLLAEMARPAGEVRIPLHGLAQILERLPPRPAG